MDDAVEQRIHDLEAKLTFQDDTLQTLNDALVEQQSRIDHLHATLKWLLERARQQGFDELEPSDDLPPPHY
ncbi:MAG: SlyX family protein [Gammaproteobacteria bacterium]|nr:SlyX family protein [Gammaproteobacteria bacterium]